MKLTLNKSLLIATHIFSTLSYTNPTFSGRFSDREASLEYQGRVIHARGMEDVNSALREKGINVELPVQQSPVKAVIERAIFLAEQKLIQHVNAVLEKNSINGEFLVEQDLMFSFVMKDIDEYNLEEESNSEDYYEEINNLAHDPYMAEEESKKIHTNNVLQYINSNPTKIEALLSTAKNGAGILDFKSLPVDTKLTVFLKEYTGKELNTLNESIKMRLGQKHPDFLEGNEKADLLEVLTVLESKAVKSPKDIENETIKAESKPEQISQNRESVRFDDLFNALEEQVEKATQKFKQVGKKVKKNMSDFFETTTNFTGNLINFFEKVSNSDPQKEAPVPSSSKSSSQEKDEWISLDNIPNIFKNAP